MKVLFSPIVSTTKKITYKFSGETFAATMNGVTDTFDLSGVRDKITSRSVTTTLAVNPLISAERKSGVLYVVLRNYIGYDATYEERFPVYVEV